MQLKSIAFLFFSTVALAQEGVEKRADETGLNMAAITDFPSDISIPSLPTNSIPSSILSVLETAVPSSVLGNLATDSSFRSSYISDIKAGSTPGWYSSLPADVKSYVSTGIINTGTAKATGTGAGATAAGAAGATGSTGKTANGALAPAPTGFVAGSVAGVAGVLAVALAL
ncbi:predicted protein [Paecilomyces variotii No. 5]|uniref:GPI anchored protein n=1 Tax=Byssochlamys spectabilis (strain No. 5 / NBRC 109023) TaxID=1356009 RepID=V5FUE0_BYSSN|nr:predicted protein [Paecilomyces variotii No. 5]